MYQLLRIIQRDTINLFINPMWGFFGVAFPFLLTAILGVLTEGAYGEIISSYDYYGVTMLLYCALYAATFSANSFLEERIKKPNMRIVYSPIKNWFIPVSKIIATFIFTTVFYSIAACLMQLVLGVNFGGKMLVYLWLLLLALDFFCSCLGVLMCCIFKSEGVANQIISIVTTLFAVLSGFFFSVASLGEMVVGISRFLPTTVVVQTAFAIIYDQDTSGLFHCIVLLGVLSVVTIILCNILFKGEDYV